MEDLVLLISLLYFESNVNTCDTVMSVEQQKKGSHRSSMSRSVPKVSVRVQLKYLPLKSDVMG